MTEPRTGGVGGRAASPARNVDEVAPATGGSRATADGQAVGDTLSTPWILHIDLDQFIAAVEVRRRPELAGRPVVVGGRGDPSERAVVATASYEARAFGVRSGMPLRVAARRCPDAVFLPHDREAYEAASAEVVDALRAFDRPPLVVEILGWDESFLGADTDDPEATARRIQAAVLDATGLHSSIGIGDTTIRAKTATGFAKPRGVFRLTADNWTAVMGDRPTGDLWGIGTKTARKLLDGWGLRTVDELAHADPAVLAATLGPTMGPWYVGLARGLGRRHVIGEPYVPRSRSRETTYQQDLLDWAQVRAATAELAQRVAADVAEDGRPAVRVAVKVRFVPFFTRTSSVTLTGPTADPAVLTAAALDVLERFEHDRPVRLLGVRAEFDRD
nr:DNA polymerase IV [Nakamurella endophytica]